MTLDEARLEATIWTRAVRLFDDGYRATRAEDGGITIESPAGRAYEIDLARKTCTCPFFVEKGERFGCKHLWGIEALLLRQEAYGRLRVDRYKRHFAVWDEAGTLVTVTVNRCGAEAVAKRLSALALCPRFASCIGRKGGAPCSH
jgi:predicted nucleic acid-binding Zn finger protein